jgi:hypothetical protein
VRRAHDAGQPGAGIDFDGSHQIEAEEREVVQIVLRQLLAAQVRVDAAKPAEAVGGDALAAEVGQLDLFRVADHDVLDVALAINQRADLPPGLVREFGELAREFGRDDPLRRNAPRVELLDAAQLVGLETLRVAFYVADTSDLLRRDTPRAGPRAKMVEATAAACRFAASLVVGLVGLEFERSERLGADAVRVAALMLPCENTSLNCRAD